MSDSKKQQIINDYILIERVLEVKQQPLKMPKKKTVALKCQMLKSFLKRMLR